jgi:ribosomal protein L29
MTKVNELRQMSDEQLQLTAKETAEKLFRLRFQAEAERLDVPSCGKVMPLPVLVTGRGR